MKLEVRKARAAAVAANLAAQAAVAARELLAEDPSAWEVGDAAYWLCRAAQKACESAADALDPEEAETNADIYELVGIYGDHGKSGRKMDGRPELGRLLADCEAGRIDLILTKSIARFSRNMRECVATIRRLQTLGVRVFFEKEGIDTSEPRNELLFHLMATIAEEESNSIGRNLMTAHEMRNRRGTPFWQRKYGYKKGADGEWVPDERPAAKVRSAFCMACAGYSVGSIRRMLIRMEEADPSGKKWRRTDVSMLLRNVLYKGDYLTQKTIRNADGTGRTKNRGEREQYYLEEHHTPLIPPEVFDHVQKLLESTALWENRRNVSPEQRALLEEGKRLSEEYGLYAVIRDNPYVEEKPYSEGKANPQQSQQSDTAHAQASNTAPDKELQERPNNDLEEEDGKIQ